MKTSWLKLATVTALTIAPLAHAKISQWSLGVAASYSPAVYKDTPSNETVIPLVGYEGEHLFLRGFSAGYRLFPAGSPQNIIFRAAYDPRTLKPSDSDNRAIQQMDERKATVLGGISYQLITLAGVLEATAGTDLGGTHNGLYAEAAWRLPFRQKGWGITPSIGYAYNSDKINDHLYGVSAAEAARAQAYDPTFSAFEADWDGQYFISASAYLRITPSVRVTGGVRYTNLEGSIESSPLIESGVTTSANIGIAYVF
ncbi:MipA/OmpV family protein [Vibrio coralliilyticus]|uniref:MipA/OmpV family protein n=1 Tax=Vibrio coralliilyticus TaxID=190893 RepID=UPI00155F8870|nr:MipA/OmpV family protein [Vibrio coralliilyticus]NRF28549.1 MipA/OmpV family protein [Vibrio coralliilyticus]NRF51640.1 MipA/OmpV family protein [Vibrio coralliilyticus]